MRRSARGVLFGLFGTCAALACGGAAFRAQRDAGADAGDGGATADGPGAGGDGGDAGDEGGKGRCTRPRFCDGGPCAASEVFATFSNGSWGLAVFDGWVYWTTTTGVFRQPETGTAVDRQQLSSVTSSGPIAVDRDSVFWLDRDSGQVKACDFPLQVPCAARLVATGPSGGNEAVGIALDKQRVYWAVAQYGAYAAPRAGGAIVTYRDGGSQFVVPYADNVYVQTNCNGGYVSPAAGAPSLTRVSDMCTYGAGGLAAGPEGIFFGGTQLTRVPTNRGAVATVATSTYISGPALACGDLYWIQSFPDSGTALFRLPASAFGDDGGVAVGARELLLFGPNGGDVAVGDLGVYYLVDGAVRRVRRDP